MRSEVSANGTWVSWYATRSYDPPGSSLRASGPQKKILRSKAHKASSWDGVAVRVVDDLVGGLGGVLDLVDGSGRRGEDGVADAAVAV